ncbi:hypothetical protein BCR34DRAFT_599315 [Clohesyomyces aquaticus]|uniref:Uncharacterized protein n=1 Tax=Clohesyomyces aquaticus TaxID=1231657 RepID=A0A1Y1ZVQ0_9PLEO|nr:hypothetical protein BCR34DRAFT_599315 [Clohesyomyces aquaticus]
MCLYIFYHHLGCSITAHTDFVGKKDCAIKTRSNKHSSSKLNLEDAGFPCPKCVVPADPDGATYYPSTDAITKAEKIGSTVRLAGVASPSGSGGESLIPTAEMKATMTRPPRSPTTLASLPYPEPEPSPLLLAQLHLFLSPKPGSAAKYALNDSVGMVSYFLSNFVNFDLYTLQPLTIVAFLSRIQQPSNLPPHLGIGQKLRNSCLSEGMQCLRSINNAIQYTRTDRKELERMIRVKGEILE